MSASPKALERHSSGLRKGRSVLGRISRLSTVGWLLYWRGNALTEIVTDIASCPDLPNGSVVTIGNFDGVHRGHKAIIRQAIGDARFEERASVIVTFDKHPAEFLRPDRAPCRLCEPAKKVELLSHLGADLLVVLTFERELADKEPEDFVTEILVGALRTRKVVVGRNFRFGRNRKGSLALLERMGRQLGFEAVEEELVSVQGFDISSTRIRAAIAHGDVEWASAALGRDHTIEGIVQRGERRGVKLGYPTMNLAPPDKICIPCDGVYAGWVLVDEERYAAAVNVGRRPTFESEGRVLIEAHLLDYDGSEAYGKRIEVGFRKWLRGEYRFADVDELIQQIGRDVEETRRVMQDVGRHHLAQP